MHKQEKKTQKRANHNNTSGRMGQLSMKSTISPIVPRLVTTMKYAETVVFSGLPLVEYLFNLNSLFDPNATGTGHQPMGFDQIKAMYDKYRVYKCRYVIQFGSTSVTATIAMAVPTNTSSGIGSLLTATEQPYSKLTKTLVQQYNPQTITGTVDLATLNGKTKRQYADDDITAAAVSANPVEQLILHVIAGTVDGTNIALNYAHVTLWYECEFFDPVQLTAS